MATVIHVYPHCGMIQIEQTEHDLVSPWEFNLLACDVCYGPDKCQQTTIVSRNYPDTLVIHGLTSCPIVQVPMLFPTDNPMGFDDVTKLVPRMSSEQVSKAFMEGFEGAVLDDAGNLRHE